jgi:hypothetical protein
MSHVSQSQVPAAERFVDAGASRAFARARWIWAPEDGAIQQGAPHAARYEFCRFSLRCAWAGGPVGFFVSADQRFILSINGTVVARGPDAGAAIKRPYSAYRTDLPAGSHEWSALVWWLGEISPYAHMSLRPGFVLAGTGAASPLLTTGVASWSVQRCGEYVALDKRKPPGAHFIGPAYRIDGRLAGASPKVPAVAIAEALPKITNGRLPSQWVLQSSDMPAQEQVEFTAWRARAECNRWIGDAGIIETGWTQENALVLAKALAQGNPVCIAPHCEWSAVLDAETIITAYPGVSVSGGRDAVIDVYWTESPGTDAVLKENNFSISKGNRDEIAGKHFFGFGDTFVASGSEAGEFLQVPWWRAGRYLLVRVRTAGETLTLRRVSCVQTGYPVRSRAFFDCPDKTFNRVLSLCERGIKASCHEVYSDCPAFEQLMYTADARVEALVHRCLETDDRLARRAVQLFNDSRHNGSGWTWSRYPAQVGQIMPVFSMIWVMMADDFLYWREGFDFVKAQLSGVRGILDVAESHLGDDNWLRGLPGWLFVDWCPRWKNGVPPSDAFGRNAAINLFYALALRAGARIEDAAGSPLRARYCRELAGRTCAAVRADCLGADGLVRDAPGVETLSEHAQALAILALFDGAGEKNAAMDAMRRATENGALAPASYYFMHYLFEACRETQSDWIHERLGAWRELLDKGLRTPIESSEPCRSDCHGWGAHPLFHAYATIAGIRPAAPGFARVHIAPLPGNLASLTVKFPWRDAAITLRLSFSGGRVTGGITLPAALSGEFMWRGKTQPLIPGKNIIET